MQIRKATIHAVAPAHRDRPIAVQIGDDEFVISPDADFTMAYAAIRILAPDVDGETILRSMPD